MKSAPNLLTNKLGLNKSARRRRGAAYFDLANELRVRIHRHSSNLPDTTHHLPANQAATTAGVGRARQLG
jgi:hypothetical protein